MERLNVSASAVSGARTYQTPRRAAKAMRMHGDERLTDVNVASPTRDAATFMINDSLIAFCLTANATDLMMGRQRAP